MKRNAVRGLIIALVLCIGSLANVAGAEMLDGKVLNPNSESALVVLKTDWWKPAPSVKSAFKLTLTAFDPTKEKLLGVPFGGSILIEAKEKNFADGYLTARIKPGRWVFQSYSQQDKWALCFNAASLQFDVKPGEVLYLGDVDANWLRRQLTNRAVGSGRTRIKGYGFVDFFDLPEGPRISAIDEDQLATVREVLSRHSPQVTAPVRAAEYSLAKFGTGSTLFAERRCGGYLSTSPKDHYTQH